MEGKFNFILCRETMSASSYFIPKSVFMMNKRRNSNNCQSDVSVEISQNVPENDDNNIRVFRISNSPDSNPQRHSSCPNFPSLRASNASDPGLTIPDSLEARHPKRIRLFLGFTEAFLKATVTNNDDDIYHCPYHFDLISLPHYSSQSHVGVVSDPVPDDVKHNKAKDDPIFLKSTSELEELEADPIMTEKTINIMYSELIRSPDRLSLLSR